MRRARAAVALACLLAAALGCARRTAEGRWHFVKDESARQAFNLPGESFLEIKVDDEGVAIRDFVSSPEVGAKTLLERRYPFGRELADEGPDLRVLYTSAERVDDHTLRIRERLVTPADEGREASEEIRTVTYVVAFGGMKMTGTDEEGHVSTYERQ